jgi:uncharacterized repeat protein (TIGR01451 family)
MKSIKSKLVASALKGERDMSTARVKTHISFGRNSGIRIAGVSALALMSAAGSVAPAYAAIDNTATASGTYGASTTTSGGSSVSVPVVPATGALTVSKTASTPTTSGGADSGVTDAGDTITYTYVVHNSGNVSLSGVTPIDTGPKFNSITGTGTLGSFNLTSGTLPLAPNADATFTAIYTLSTLDVLHAAGVTNGVVNSATATGTSPSGTVTSGPSTAKTTIQATPQLTIVKSATLDDTNGTVAGKAEVGETITYLYTITNSGNVALTDVSVNDVHEGTALPLSSFTNETLVTEGPLGTPASTDTTAGDGKWSVLQPGAKITFTYVHTVTQTEVDNQ